MVLEIRLENCSRLTQLISGLLLFFCYFYLFENKFFIKISRICPPNSGFVSVKTEQTVNVKLSPFLAYFNI